MKVVFVGAGPGDKELITLKGYNALKEADVVIWAGSLVNEALLEYCKTDVEIYNSALMHLEEILTTCAEGVKAGKKVVRLHTGDFSIYGSLREQIEGLQALDIEYEFIPGVSSFLGAASSLGVEYTIPEVSQSLIITRRGGRTPVPEKESLKAFAKHGTSMVIFLSSTYTPAAIVFKATWPDEEIIRGTLMTLPPLAKEKNIHKMSLIMVGDFLGHAFNRSKLYDKDFKHEYRP